MAFYVELAEHVKKMTKTAKKLYVVDVKPEVMYEAFLESFAQDDNKMFRERREHDCNSCRRFIRDFGNVVAIIGGKVVSVWDFTTTETSYQPSIDAMSKLVHEAKIESFFVTPEVNFGNVTTIENREGTKITWHHMHASIPASLRYSGSTLGAEVGLTRDTRNVFMRCLTELTLDAVNQVLDLIAQNTLYKGPEYKEMLKSFKEEKVKFDKIKDANDREIYVWDRFYTIHESVAKIRDSSVGSLLVDLSEGKELEPALKAYEVKTAPANYKRPKGVFSAKQLADATKDITSMGYITGLKRRFAVIDDVSVENAPFTDRNVQSRLKNATSSLDLLAAEVKPSKKSVKSLDKAETISIEKFMSDVLPSITSMEAFVDNTHVQNFVSLIAPVDPASKPLFKWDNSFCWAYTGNVADSMKELVAERGGRVDGVLRFSHSWNYEGRNASLMDLHVFLPGSTFAVHHDGCHDNYPDGQRVGWNNRNDAKSKGTQDVDYTHPAPEGYVPVENITFPSMSLLKEGQYTFKIHNWNLRSPTNSGFKAQIELNGTVYDYEVKRPLKHKEWITVATAVLHNGTFTINHHIDPVSESSTDKWGIATKQFHPVTICMKSPNFWNDHTGHGHLHYFFMLKDCINPEEPNGFFNEYLCKDLEKHRQVFEVLGNKESVQSVEDQLSGLGFSSSKRATLTVKVHGSFTRVLNITF